MNYQRRREYILCGFKLTVPLKESILKVTVQQRPQFHNLVTVKTNHHIKGSAWNDIKGIENIHMYIIMHKIISIDFLFKRDY